MKELTNKERLEVLDRTIKVFQGKCHRCDGELCEIRAWGCDERFVRCSKCEKMEQGDTFGEAYLLFCISK